MSTRPEALRLAEKMESYSLASGYAWHCHKAAAELRRLHALNQELVEALKPFAAYGRPGSRDVEVAASIAALAKASGSATQTGETE